MDQILEQLPRHVNWDICLVQYIIQCTIECNFKIIDELDPQKFYNCLCYGVEAFGK